MKTNIAFDFSELDRRTVRAALKRGGMATRKELRIFVDRAIRDALAKAPEPKPKRQKKAAPVVDQKRHALDTWPDDTRCTNCNRVKADHGRMSQSCLPSPGLRKGTRFKFNLPTQDRWLSE